MSTSQDEHVKDFWFQVGEDDRIELEKATVRHGRNQHTAWVKYEGHTVKGESFWLRFYCDPPKGYRRGKTRR